MSLAGSAGITDSNMINYLGAFEIILDSFVAKYSQDTKLLGALFDDIQTNNVYEASPK